MAFIHCCAVKRIIINNNNNKMNNTIEFKHKSWSVCLSLPVGYQKKPLVFFFDTLSESENFIKNNYKKFYFTPRKGKNAIIHRVTTADNQTLILQTKTFTVVDGVLTFGELETINNKLK